MVSSIPNIEIHIISKALYGFAYPYLIVKYMFFKQSFLFYIRHFLAQLYSFK